MTNPDEALCAFAANSRGPLPQVVLDQVKRSLLNMLACALAGSRSRTIAAMAETLAPFTGEARAVVIGRTERTDVPTAASLNCASANLHDYDDTHLPTIIHPSAPVSAPLLALACMRRISGQDFARAFAIGVDVACRLGNAISPEHYQRGWHITATCGTVGAAAGVGHVLGLSSTEMAHALAIAAGQASGTVENLGIAAKSR